MADTETDEGTTPDENEPTDDTSTDDNDAPAAGSETDGDEQQPDGNKPETPRSPSPADLLGDAGKRALQAERKARQAAEKELARLREDAARRAEAAKGADDAETSETQRLAKEVAELREKHTAAELRAMRSEIARTTGVPVDQLTATTETDLAAQAASLIEWVEAEVAKRKPDKPAVPAAAKPKEKLRSGAAGSTPGEPTVEDRLAALLGKRRK
jgi:hypothetical protein